jgi:hypothetical protein
MADVWGLVAPTYRVLRFTIKHAMGADLGSIHVTVQSTSTPKKKKNKVRKRTIPTVRPSLPAKLVPPFADRGSSVISATDPYGR